jgi:circadian clock protein KaiC
MEDAVQAPRPLERVPTGIPGLDTILQGGVFRGGMYLIMGQPGAGKTILGNQICFHHVATGGRAVYVTLLAESHARMLMHIQALAFFNPTAVGDTLYYLSGYEVAEQSALSQLLDLLRRVIRERRPSLMVLDGLSTTGQVAGSELAFQEFLHKLHVFNEAAGCTLLMLTHEVVSTLSRPEHTMADGLLELRDVHVRMHTVRELEVHKLRGANYLRGRHSYEISDAGIVVHPRTEAVIGKVRLSMPVERGRVSFGVKELDTMLNGGLMAGSTTMLFGPPGSGKTLLGLNMLGAGAAAGQPGLYFGFHETPPLLVAIAAQVGMHLEDALRDGRLEILWQPPVEGDMDVLAERMLTAVRQRQVRHLFIDGLSGFQEGAVYPERIARFFTALTNELRERGVTTIFSIELRHLISPSIEIPIEGVSAIAENIIFLRYVELRSQLYRLLSIMKVRESDYDPSIREFKISRHGIEVATTFESAEAVLTGMARPLPPNPASPPPDDASRRSRRRTP